MFSQGILVLSKGMTGRSVYYIVNASKQLVISRVRVRIRLDRPKTRPRGTVNVKVMRVDNNAAAFHLARNSQLELYCQQNILYYIHGVSESV